MMTVTRSVAFGVEGRRRRGVGATSGGRGAEAAGGRPGAEAATDAPVGHVGRVPRVSKLMALAIRFQRLLDEGVVASQSELAELAHVTQPRMTQIMNLLLLAPDIQEELLFLPEVLEGRDPVTERDLRPLVGMRSWGEQREAWEALHGAT